MSAPCSPPSMRGTAARRRAGHANPGERISDAERNEAADRLSKHYGDGRLDEAEFNQRLDQAMSAKTRLDLSGLFADLPGAEESESAPRERHSRRRRPLHRVLALVIIITATAIVGHALARSLIPWLLIGLVVFIWLRSGNRRNRRP
jgi:Flp pilus assembly protein TadB